MTSLSIQSRFLVIGLSALSLVIVALPGFAHAATYAYVNTSGEVSTVNADNPAMAMATAIGISIHSGVLLLESMTDAVVGDGVGGV